MTTPAATTRPRTPEPSLRGVILFTLAYLVVGGVLAVRGANWEFLLYIGVVVGIGLGLLAIRKRAGLSLGLFWALSLWGLLHVIGGLLPVPESWPIAGDKRVFYSCWIIPGYLKYDNPVHALGFAVATWAVWQGLKSATGITRPSLGLLVITALAGSGLGALNEVLEFFTTLLMDTNVGGYVNTGWDLVANLVGASSAAALIGWLEGRRPA